MATPIPTANPMTYRPLGRCGTKVSTFSLGGWTTFGGSITDETLTRSIVRTAFDAGVNFFDLADVYARGECEKLMGRVLRGLPRDRLVVSTKVFWPMSDDVNDRGLGRKHVMQSIDASLKRLGMDYVDVYFCHRYDVETPLEETVRAMDDLVRAGKILHWGTSEWTGAQIRDAHDVADGRNAYGPQVEQPQYSLLVREKVERDVLPAALETGMGVVVWSPLASGLLTGKYDDLVPAGSRLAKIDWLRDQVRTEARLATVRAFGKLASEAGISRTRLALAWAAAREGVSSVILGATSVEQLKENLSAHDVQLDAPLLARLDAIFGGAAGAP
jgi:voltage-dependent potassium channel beta subunit